MYNLIKEATNNMNAAIELSTIKKDVVEVVDAISNLSLDETIKLGSNFKKFPIGSEVIDIEIKTNPRFVKKEGDILGNCSIANMMGASINISAYEFVSFTQNFNKKPIELLNDINDIVDVPITLDYFGNNCPNRLPQSILNCRLRCYTRPPYTNCNIKPGHIDSKDIELLENPENWIKLTSLIAINLINEELMEGDAISNENIEKLVKLSKKYNKPLESLLIVGDGYDNLITGFEKAINYGSDIFTIEGGPFNTNSNPIESFAKAIVSARILCPGKIVATNGAYESELKIGLKAGLNTIKTGFNKCEQTSLCGYKPETINSKNFGIPKILHLIKEELQTDTANRNTLINIATTSKIIGIENFYPQKIGKYTIGDAKWKIITNSNLYQNITLKNTIQDIINNIKGNNVYLHGGGYLSWIIAEQLDKQVDEIIISDKNPWIEKITIENLEKTLNATIIRGNQQFEEINDHIITTTSKIDTEKIKKIIPNATSFT